MPVAQSSDGPPRPRSRTTDSTLSDARVARALNEGLRSLDPADQKNLAALVSEIFGNDRIDETIFFSHTCSFPHLLLLMKYM